MRQSTETRISKLGNLVYATHAPGERYMVDFADDFKAQGWRQYDTDQDAHYFGVWVNPTKLQTLTYAEGDWTLVVCPDVAHYNEQIRGANEFYGEGRIARVIDAAGGVTDLVQDRGTFTIKETP